MLRLLLLIIKLLLLLLLVLLLVLLLLLLLGLEGSQETCQPGARRPSRGWGRGQGALSQQVQHDVRDHMRGQPFDH